jgi:CRISPR system Cascade subunit CasE
MYLSQLSLDRLDRRIMRTLSDIYLLHQFVMSGFAAYDRLSRVLFRVEPEMKDDIVRLLVQSSQMPCWERSAPIIVSPPRVFSPKFREGAKFRFRLRSNPAVKRDGKRLGLVRDDALVGWLKQREKMIGIAILSVLAIDEGYVTGMRKKEKQKDHVNIKIARFEGILEVTDPECLNKALAEGIGPAKGFGCGLLSLARA